MFSIVESDIIKLDLKHGELYDGRGPSLGPNSPFKISPFLVWFCNITFRDKNIIYTKEMEIDETDGNDGYISS